MVSRTLTCPDATPTNSTHTLLGENVMLSLIQDGSHRLSRPQDIEKILYTADDLNRSIADGKMEREFI